MKIFSSTTHLLLLTSTWDVWGEQPTCTLVPICSFFSHSQICHTPHTHTHMRALHWQFVKSLTTCLDKNFVRSPKLGPDMCVHSEKRNGNMSCHCLCQKYFSKTFQRAKIGTWHVYAFWNMQWHSSLACSCKNPHNGERVKWLTLAICVEHYSLRFVHAYALAGDSVCPNVLK